ncbi:MAG: hypothetical protein GX138_04740 [Firmicutes bacterium]|nr:hypothetical protein [Bacillota bacterium]
MKNIEELIAQSEERLSALFKGIDQNSLFNQERVLNAFRAERVSELHLQASTGYGYANQGRDILDKIYAKVMGTEAALVRSQFISGTHALATALRALLDPGQTLLSLTGSPYDTLRQVIGIEGTAPKNLASQGVKYKEIDIFKAQDRGALIEAALKEDIQAVFIQRSRGYEWRDSLNIVEMQEIIEKVKEINPKVLVMVDNCYGEFTETLEPGHIGADLLAGSLIKNPGGGLASGGGYIAGIEELVENAAAIMTAPGLGLEMGPAFGDSQRLMFQGLFLAPHIVSQSLKGMHLVAAVMAQLGFEVSPKFDERRSDVIQAIRFQDSETLIEFCRSVQRVSPIDSHLHLEPWAMPGYEHPVIMAAGAFIQGSSIELSADAPIREPYTAYIQGGLTYEHVKLALKEILQNLPLEM